MVIPIEALTTTAASILGVDRECISWFSWPQSFGQTSPTGMGGQTMTTVQVLAFVNNSTGECVLECCGNWKRKNHFEPLMKF